MKHLSHVLTETSQKPQKHLQETILDPGVCKVINELFGFFYAICRGFKKQYQDANHLSAEKTQWILAFMDVGFSSMESIKWGIKRARLESPINTPTIGQFITWCQPTTETLGIPDTEKAFQEACINSHPTGEKIWSHKLVKHARELTGSYLLMNSPRSKSFPVFERNYQLAIQQWLSGMEIKEIQIPKALTKEKSPKNEQVRRDAIAECMRILKS